MCPDGDGVTKCFLAPGYFCPAKGLDGIVPAKGAKGARRTLTLRAGGRSWPVVHMRGKGLSGGWRRAAIDLGIARGDRLVFTSDRAGELRLTVHS